MLSLHLVAAGSSRPHCFLLHPTLWRLHHYLFHKAALYYILSASDTEGNKELLSSISQTRILLLFLIAQIWTDYCSQGDGNCSLTQEAPLALQPQGLRTEERWLSGQVFWHALLPRRMGDGCWETKATAVHYVINVRHVYPGIAITL